MTDLGRILVGATPSDDSHLGPMCTNRHVWQQNADGWEICLTCKWHRPTYSTLTAALTAVQERIVALEAAQAELIEKAAGHFLSIAKEAQIRSDLLPTENKWWAVEDMRAAAASAAASYLRSLLTPDMLAAQQAQQGAAELMRETAAQAALFHGAITTQMQVEIAAAIRALPLPSASSVLAVLTAAQAVVTDPLLEHICSWYPTITTLREKLAALDAPGQRQKHEDQDA